MNDGGRRCSMLGGPTVFYIRARLPTPWICKERAEGMKKRHGGEV